MSPAKQDIFEAIGNLSDTVLCPAYSRGVQARWPSLSSLQAATAGQWMVSADQAPILADGQWSSWTKPVVS